MTSDAKVGLLLGLVFIFIIAFLINGLPKFRSDNNNELTSTMFSSQNDGLGGRERRVIEQNEPIIRYRPIVQLPPRVEPDVRFEMQLPKGPLDGKAIAEGKSVGPSQSFATVKERQEPKVRLKKPAPPKAYVVMTGDSLTVIARKFYGAKEGNRLANVMRIFQANRGILKSADQIYEGQKIIIPPLPGLASVKESPGRILPSKVLEKVGIRRVLKGKEGGRYVVRDGDSLWRIAARQLGDGARYTEIAKLNADILDDEDCLTAGMRLKMPRR